MIKLLVRIFQAGEPTDESTAFRTLRIIHFAVCASVFIYGLLAYLMIEYGTMPEGGFVRNFPNLNVLRAVIYLLVAGSYAMIRIFKARFLTPEALRRRTMPVVLSMNWLHIAMFALAEAIAIYGFLLFLISALLHDFLVLAGVSLLVLYWLRPKEDAYHALVRQVLRT